MHNMLLNLTIACNFVQVELNALQTLSTCRIHIKKSEPNGEKPACSFRAEYANFQACCEDRHAIDALTSSELFGKYSFACFPPITVTSDVIYQFYVRLVFGLKLVLVMIKVGTKFRL